LLCSYCSTTGDFAVACRRSLGFSEKTRAKNWKFGRNFAMMRGTENRVAVQVRPCTHVYRNGTASTAHQRFLQEESVSCKIADQTKSCRARI
jgi:hypothetical protein